MLLYLAFCTPNNAMFPGPFLVRCNILGQFRNAVALHFSSYQLYDPRKAKPRNDVKIFISLPEEEKRTIKKAAAENNATLSNFLYQAEEYYLENKDEIDIIPNHSVKKGKTGGRKRQKSLQEGKNSPKNHLPFT